MLYVHVTGMFSNKTVLTEQKSLQIQQKSAETSAENHHLRSSHTHTHTVKMYIHHMGACKIYDKQFVYMRSCIWLIKTLVQFTPQVHVYN